MKVPSTASSVTMLSGVPLTSNRSISRIGSGLDTDNEMRLGPSRSAERGATSSCVTGRDDTSAGGLVVV
jgi:hypothetical protein